MRSSQQNASSDMNRPEISSLDGLLGRHSTMRSADSVLPSVASTSTISRSECISSLSYQID